MVCKTSAGAALLALLCWAISAAASGATRVALVIGNAAYEHTHALPTPVHDATDIANALRGLGYSVRLVTNGRKSGMEAALTRFSREAAGADEALIYYAGHGVATGGINYLLPVDAGLSSESAVPREAVALPTVLRAAAAPRHLGLVVLDACRESPLADRTRRASGSRAAAKGLAAVKPTGNLLVAYATRDGHVAGDGAGRISPYARAILEALQVPGLEIRPFWKRVHDRVVSATHGQQQPALYGTLGTPLVYLNPPAPPAHDAHAGRPAAAAGGTHAHSAPVAPGDEQSTFSLEEGKLARAGTPAAALLEELRKVCGNDIRASWFETSEIHLGDPKETDLMILITESYKGACPSSASGVPVLAARMIGQKYEVILTASGVGLNVQETRHQGYRDIEASTAEGDTIYTLTYQYDGHQYAEVERRAEKIE